MVLKLREVSRDCNRGERLGLLHGLREYLRENREENIGGDTEDVYAGLYFLYELVGDDLHGFPVRNFAPAWNLGEFQCALLSYSG